MKTKIAILIGITVCVILLTSPALASAGYTKIYGNANEDDVLDMRDVTYIKLVIFGKKPATTFADANDDGKISMLDVGQTKLIILGKEKEITLIDMADRTVTLYRPVERVIVNLPPVTRMVIGLGAKDKLVGIDSRSHGGWSMGGSSGGFGPEWEKVIRGLRDLPVVGGVTTLNEELMLSLNPDVVIAYAGITQIDICDKFQKDTGIPVVGYRTSTSFDHLYKEIEMVGTVLGKEERAEEIVSLFKEKLDKVTEVTLEIPDSEKPRVYHIWGHTFVTKASIRYEPVELAGGILVSKDCAPPTSGGSVIDVSKEQIIKWNPDIILLMVYSTNPKLTVENILNDPDFQTISAVKNQNVYPTPGAFYFLGPDPPRAIWETLYTAKLFHPEKFKDLDLEEEGNELFGRFYGVDGLWTEIGGTLGFV